MRSCLVSYCYIIAALFGWLFLALYSDVCKLRHTHIRAYFHHINKQPKKPFSLLNLNYVYFILHISFRLARNARYIADHRGLLPDEKFALEAQTNAEKKVGLAVSAPGLANGAMGANGSSSSSSSSSSALGEGGNEVVLRQKGTILDIAGMEALAKGDASERPKAMAQEYIDAMLNSKDEADKHKRLRLIKHSAGVVKRGRRKDGLECKPRRKFYNYDTKREESEELPSSDEDGHPGYEVVLKKQKLADRRGKNVEELDKPTMLSPGYGGSPQIYSPVMDMNDGRAKIVSCYTK